MKLMIVEEEALVMRGDLKDLKKSIQLRMANGTVDRVGNGGFFQIHKSESVLFI